MIAEGALDGDEGYMDTLAERLGVGERQLRRLFRQHVGASPSAVARTRRVLFAKQLIHETSLSMTEVALAAGFGSVRQFNETFQTLFQRAPSEIRRTVRAPSPNVGEAGVTVRLRYRPPYDWAAVLGHLGARAIDGVERVQNGVYSRTVLERGRVGTVAITHDPEQASIVATIRLPDVFALSAVIARIRRMFDVDAEVTAIANHLARDPLLAPLVMQRPGLRVVGGWDGFELAVRAVLGQQITVEAARTLTQQLVQLCRAPTLQTADELGLVRAFPMPAHVVSADLSSMKMPSSRKQSLGELARAAQANPRLFQARATVEETVAQLGAIRGIGDWTAQYIALRAAREPDAFPSCDVALLRSISARTALASPSELVERAKLWRPWRGYAAQHLWTADAAERIDRRGDNP